MEEKMIQQQIDDINRKLDIVIEEVMAQKQVRQTAQDLVTDVSVIGKDMFKAAVTELDGAGVEIDGEAVKMLLLKVARNIDTLYEVFDLMESGMDLLHDTTPILRQVGLDGIKILNQMESKGYIDFLKESMNIMDNIVAHFSLDDVRSLADNVVTILETVKNLTQPDMLDAINNGLVVYKSMDVENVPEYSLFKAAKAMNAPEMRKGLGFMITFLKNIAKESENGSEKNK